MSQSLSTAVTSTALNILLSVLSSSGFNSSGSDSSSSTSSWTGSSTTNIDVLVSSSSSVDIEPSPPAPVQNIFDVSTGIVPAVIFVILFGTLIPIIIYRLYRESWKIYSYWYFLLFCQFRFFAYVFRAIMSQNAQEWNEIASGVLLAGGFIVLMNGISIYFFSMLKLLRIEHEKQCIASNNNNNKNNDSSSDIYSRFLSFSTHFPLMTHLYLMCASGLCSYGAVAAGIATTDSDLDSANQLRRIGAIMFLAIISVYAQLFLIFGITHIKSTYYTSAFNIGQYYLLRWLLPVAILIIIRCIYSVLYLYINDDKFTSDDGFYPMEATVEFITIIILLLPGLAKKMENLSEQQQDIPNNSSSDDVQSNKLNNVTIIGSYSIPEPTKIGGDISIIKEYSMKTYPEPHRFTFKQVPTQIERQGSKEFVEVTISGDEE